MTFGEKVRTLRKERGISQSELARAIGVSTRTVASYEGDVPIQKCVKSTTVWPDSLK